jgi:uncharacterized membrane protein
MESLVTKYHLHPIIDHFTIALLSVGVLVDVLGYGLAALFGERIFWLASLHRRVTQAAPVLLIPGTISAIFSRITGEMEAERLWDTITPAAQEILFSADAHARVLSHAVLGTYLVYLFLTLTAWRILIDSWTRFRWTQPIYVTVAAVALGALLYQGKTGGQLVYDQGVATNHTSVAVRPSTNPK